MGLARTIAKALLPGWVRDRLRMPVSVIDGVKIPVSHTFPDAMQQVLYGGWKYEYEERQILAAHLGPDDVVMEIGTGIGLLTTLCAKRVGDDRVFTFEANASMEPYIRRTFKLNGVNPTLETCMIGARTGSAQFYANKWFWASSVFDRFGGTRVTVPVRAFNEEVRRLDPTFLIMDVEGAEHELISEADFGHIRKLLIELHANFLSAEQIVAVRKRLERAGFREIQWLPSNDVLVCYYERAEVPAPR